MPSFQSLAAPRPPVSRSNDLIAERERLLVVTDGENHEGTDVWELSDGGWARVATGLFPLPESQEDTRVLGPPLSWIDPKNGEATIARIFEDGLRTLRLSRRDEVAFYPYPFGEFRYVPEAWGVWHAKRGTPVLLVNRANDAKAFAIDGAALTELGDAPYLLAFAPVRDAGVAVGYDVGGTLWALDGEAFYEVLSDRKMVGLAWYPPLETIVTFRAADGGEAMTLASWEDGGFVDVDPPIRCEKYRSGGRLAITADLRIAYYGGQDFEKNGDLTNGILVSEPGGKVLRADDKDEPVLGHGTTVVTGGNRLVVADASSMRIMTPTDSGWRRVVVPAEKDNGTVDRRYVSFTASATHVFMLDANGALHSADEGGRFQLLARAEPGPGSHYVRRVALAWDALSERVVVFGGVESNSTWVAGRDTHGFLELRPPSPPPHGIGSMASTPHGVYLLVEGTIHRFTAGRWHCVAPAAPGNHLLYDPKRDRLMTAGWDRSARLDGLWVIDASGIPHLAAHFPKSARLATATNDGAGVGVDPPRDRLLVLHKNGAWVLALATIDVASRGVPTRPTDPPTKRLATAPPHWTRPAASLTAGAPCSTPNVRVEGTLVALLPAHPRALPLPPGYVGIAISETDDWPETDARPWELGGGGYHARLVSVLEPFAPVVVEGGFARELVVEDALAEIDAAHVLEVDTPANGVDRRAWGSKLGGYPRYVQDDPTEAWQGPPLRFAAQLAAPLIHAGDVGKLYVWITDEPEPRALVVMQSH